jgi:hypothetical protein
LPPECPEIWAMTIVSHLCDCTADTPVSMVIT